MKSKAAKITGAKRLTFTAPEVYSPGRTSIPWSSGTRQRVQDTFPSRSLGKSTVVKSCSFCLYLFFVTVTLRVRLLYLIL